MLVKNNEVHLNESFRKKSRSKCRYSLVYELDGLQMNYILYLHLTISR